jgi:hypothetical protein
MGAIRLYTPQRQVEPDIKEALRYMGYGRNVPDEDMMNIVSGCAESLTSVISARCCYTQAEVTETESGVALDGRETGSKALRKNLHGCSTAYIFAATVGIEADRLIRRNGAVSPAREVITDALASSAIEALCDMLCEHLAGFGGRLRPRFSPGYGDLDISFQKDMCQMLDTARKIGLTLTDSMLLMPTKSVTAIVGQSNE